MSEALGQAGRDALATERAARKAAEREVAELRKYRRKFYEMRDKAELWEARAIRYSNKLRILQNHTQIVVKEITQ